MRLTALIWLIFVAVIFGGAVAFYVYKEMVAFDPNNMPITTTVFACGIMFVTMWAWDIVTTK